MLDHEKDRLDYKYQDAITEQQKDFMSILQAKTENKKATLRKIEKHAK